RMRASVEAHIASCAACRGELNLLRVARRASVAPRVNTDRIVGTIPTYAATRRRRLVAGAWKIAAAIVVVVGGAALLARDANEPAKQMAEAPQPASSAVVTPNPVHVLESATIAKNSISAVPTELTTGETLHDLSESELKSLLREIA